MAVINFWTNTTVVFFIFFILVRILIIYSTGNVPFILTVSAFDLLNLVCPIQNSCCCHDHIDIHRQLTFTVYEMLYNCIIIYFLFYLLYLNTLIQNILLFFNSVTFEILFYLSLLFVIQNNTVEVGYYVLGCNTNTDATFCLQVTPNWINSNKKP